MRIVGFSGHKGKLDRYTFLGDHDMRPHPVEVATFARALAAKLLALDQPRAHDANFSVFDSLLDLLKITEDGTGAHRVKGKNVVAVKQHE